jgi:hypothetical protein
MKCMQIAPQLISPQQQGKRGVAGGGELKKRTWRIKRLISLKI